MNILICGTMLDRSYETKLSRLSSAGNQFQNNMKKALVDTNAVRTLSYISIPIELPPAEIESESVVCVRRTRIEAVKRYRRKLSQQCQWADVVIAYNCVYAWFNLPVLCKRYNTKSVLVLADFTPPEGQSRIIMKAYSRATISQVRKYDKVVTLSSETQKYLLPHQECVTVNGCIDYSQFANMQRPSKKETVNITYTGLVSRVTGVDLLLRAFEILSEPHYRLVICGQGEELKDEINEASKRDLRIQYKGYLSHDDYLKVLEDADVLVNPRNMNLPENKNNFPSKVLEYIATGRPVVSTKFVDWKEYNQFVLFAESTADSLAEMIEQAEKLDRNTVFLANRGFAKSRSWSKSIIQFV